MDCTKIIDGIEKSVDRYTSKCSCGKFYKDRKRLEPYTRYGHGKLCPACAKIAREKMLKEKISS